MKKALILLFLIFSTSTFSKSFVGKLITNVQENDGAISKFVLMTKDGNLRIKLENEKFIRALYKLSGEVLMVTGTLEENSNDLDFSMNANDLSETPVFSARIGIPTTPIDTPILDEFDQGTTLSIEQYTVAVNEMELSGTIRNDWVNDQDMYFIKDEQGIDHVVIVLEDIQNDFYDNYSDKEVVVKGSIVTFANQKQFIVKKIKLK